MYWHRNFMGRGTSNGLFMIDYREIGPMGRRPVVLSCCVMVLSYFPAVLNAQEFTANYDESKVPAYALPDPLVSEDGTRVTALSTWVEKRRPEILRLFADQMYGATPDETIEVRSHVIDSTLVMNGRAIRKQVDLTFCGNGKDLTVAVLLYIPAGEAGPAPAFLGLNFGGNHTIRDDPGIRLNTNWMRPSRDRGIVDNRATEATRGRAASRWTVEKIVERGYALVTAYYGDIDPDFDDGFRNGIHPLFYPGTQVRPGPGEWGSIGAWAWGLSRILDYLETDDAIAHRNVAVLGHSRLGKTSLWAGAQDERFALVISNDSGCGGAALSRRAFGETVGRINTSFPHWFCANFKQYNEREDLLPVDQHMLAALIAPRPVYVASAEEDQWADPRGEFLSVKHASPVYRLLGVEGLGTERMPAVNQPVIGRLSYHVRSGGHDVTDFDWEQYLNCADQFLKQRSRSGM